MEKGRDPYTLKLPMPPSANNLFPTIGGKRVPSPKYRAWKQEADDVLWLHKPVQHFEGRVAVAIAVGKPKGLSDIDNRVKPILDWLVGHQIIVNDDYRYVREVSARWDDSVEGAVVTVRSIT